jgi:4-aminobutyrate aminotransferase/(S)-3-amino-2-methylpropionate transaminase
MIEQKRILATSIPGPASQALQQRKVAAVAAGVSTGLPVYVTEASGGILRDADGNQLIDFGSGIAVTTVGNGNQRIIDAVTEQITAFTHTCFMVTPYEGYVAVCERLNRLTPGTHEKRSALFNSGRRGGGERGEDRPPRHRAQRGGGDGPRLPRAHQPHHGPHRQVDAVQDGLRAVRSPTSTACPWPTPTAGPEAPTHVRAREAAAAAIDHITTEIGADRVAAVVVEPIQGEGGFIVPGAGYLPGPGRVLRPARHRVRGRRDPDRVRPHRPLVRLRARGRGPRPRHHRQGHRGRPAARRVTGRAELMDAVHVGGLGGTYGGNPVACAAALAAIESMEADNLAARAREIGDILTDRLGRLAEKYDEVGEVRGRGAMIAMELVTDAESKEPAAALTSAVNKGCHERGLVTLTCGTYGNVFRFLPPLSISDDLLHEGMDVLEESFTAAVG